MTTKKQLLVETNPSFFYSKPWLHKRNGHWYVTGPRLPLGFGLAKMNKKPKTYPGDLRCVVTLPFQKMEDAWRDYLQRATGETFSKKINGSRRQMKAEERLVLYLSTLQSATRQKPKRKGRYA